MRSSLVGAALIAGLVIAGTAVRSSSEPAYGPPVEPLRAAGDGLVTHVTAPEGQPQIVTVVDPRQRVLAVYHVDRVSGQIALKSVRNITWDLQMPEYDTGEPLPKDIRSSLAQ